MRESAWRAPPRSYALRTEEERAWVSFYRRVGKDPVIAAEVLTQLEADTEMKREHMALYLCCRESLRLQQAREERHQRIGQFVRWLASCLFFRAPQAAGRVLGRSRDLAMACLPPGSTEPAVPKVRRLAKEPKVRGMRAAYEAAPVIGAGAPQTAPDDKSAKPRPAQASG